MLTTTAAQNIIVFLNRVPVTGVSEAAALVNAAAEMQAYVTAMRDRAAKLAEEAKTPQAEAPQE